MLGEEAACSKICQRKNCKFFAGKKVVRELVQKMNQYIEFDQTRKPHAPRKMLGKFIVRTKRPSLEVVLVKMRKQWRSLSGSLMPAAGRSFFTLQQMRFGYD